MKKVIIIGAGFAGLAALERLVVHRKQLEVTLIDKKESFDFLPLLPDTLGRRVPFEFLSYKIPNITDKLGVNFIKEGVSGLDLENFRVTTASKSLAYDYLVLASGSETNFYGNNNICQFSRKLDDLNDAIELGNILEKTNKENFIISGGGYTGIEVATNLRIFLSRNKRKGRIVILERAPSILGLLSSWMKEYVGKNLKRLDIEVMTNCAVDKIDGENVLLADKRVFEKSLLIWTAGVRTADFVQSLKVEKTPQGRIKTDRFLAFSKDCFAAGDACGFFYKSNLIRMAVQFSLNQGCVAAENIIRSLKDKELREFRPLDLGFVVPMANNFSCGSVLGRNVSGGFATFMHFVMCAYRSRGLKNKFGIITNFFKKGG